MSGPSSQRPRRVVAGLATVACLAGACGCGHETAHPSSARPDQLLLTLPGDPRTALTVSWRQSPAGTADRVEVLPPGPAPSWSVPATCAPLDSADGSRVTNDPVVRRCTAVLDGLQPGTGYAYRVVDPARPDPDAAWHRVRTAPAGPDGEVAFLWLGDVQQGIEAWSARYEAAARRHPEARFTLQVGDLVDRGDRRGLYDAVFAGAPEAFATLPFVPVVGNHEGHFGGLPLFERTFALAGDGPSGPGHCRAFDYGPVRVVVLDSGDDDTLAAQAEWLAARLDESRAPWKVVAFHHPVWPPRRWFTSRRIRDAWMETLEAHGAHLVLNGHDHSYARTVPLRGGVPAAGGTVYAVAVAGSKSYGQSPSERFAAALEDTPTYQVVTASPDRLALSTRTWDGAEVDRWERGR